jgi:hypothetical protein
MGDQGETSATCGVSRARLGPRNSGRSGISGLPTAEQTGADQKSSQDLSGATFHLRLYQPFKSITWGGLYEKGIDNKKGIYKKSYLH